jgi:hypothetical protein
MKIHDWITIAHATGDLLYFIAAVIVLITAITATKRK